MEKPVVPGYPRFPAISRLLLEPGLNLRYHMDEARTSFRVLSLPKMGYDVDKLRGLIWSPLLAIREGGLGILGETHRKSRLINCTGVFQQTTAELDWDSGPDDGDDSEQEDESDEGDESDSDDDGSDTDTSGEDDYDKEDIDKEDNGTEDNDEENN